MDRYGEHSFLYQYGMTGKFPSWKSSPPPSLPLSAGEESSYNKENRKLSFPSMAAQEKKKWARPLQWKNKPRLLSFLSASACSIQRIPVNKGEKL